MAQTAIEREVCTCGLDVRPEIWLCPRCHVYRKDKQAFTSVTRVIKSMLPADYSKVDPVVLECARLRGQFVDSYFCDWLNDPANVVPLSDVRPMIEPEFPREREKHSQDAVNRIEMLCNWWLSKQFRVKDVQRTVFSEKDKVAGTMDVGTEELIADIKCVAELQPNYALQLGAYREYDTQEFPPRETAIIHVLKDRVKLVPFKAKTCREQWRNCVGWYWTQKELTA